MRSPRRRRRRPCGRAGRVASMPSASTRTAAAWASRWRAPGRVAAIGGALRCVDDVVELALRRREAAVGGKGARDVAGVAVELAAGVDQAELAGAQLSSRPARSAGRRRWRRRRRSCRRPGRRRRGAGTRAGTRPRSRTRGSASPRSRAKRAAQKRIARSVRVGADRGGAAHRLELAGVLDEAHLGEQRREIVLRARRLDARRAPCARTRSSQPSILAPSSGVSNGHQTAGWLESASTIVSSRRSSAHGGIDAERGRRARRGRGGCRPRARARRPSGAARRSCGRRRAITSQAPGSAKPVR